MEDPSKEMEANPTTGPSTKRGVKCAAGPCTEGGDMCVAGRHTEQGNRCGAEPCTEREGKQASGLTWIDRDGVRQGNGRENGHASGPYTEREGK